MSAMFAATAVTVQSVPFGSADVGVMVIVLTLLTGSAGVNAIAPPQLSVMPPEPMLTSSLKLSVTVVLTATPVAPFTGVTLVTVGEILSWVYINGSEQVETFPAASLAVARIVVVVLNGSVMLMPGDAKVAADPWAIGEPEQSLVVWSLTVEPASAVPKMFGVPLLLGEKGELNKPVG